MTVSLEQNLVGDFGFIHFLRRNITYQSGSHILHDHSFHVYNSVHWISVGKNEYFNGICILVKVYCARLVNPTIQANAI